MSLKKIGEHSNYDRKAALHEESWKEEMEQSIGRSTRELGIYNRPEVEGRIRQLYENIPQMKEFEFLKELKALSADIGVYVVGGSVRDAVLNKPAKDIDLIINRIDPVALVNIILRHGKVTFDRYPKADLTQMSEEEKEKLIKDSYGVIKFSPHNSTLGEQIDIAFPREDDYSQSGQAGILGIKRDTDSTADPQLDIVRDLERRDLTINAMAVNIMNGNIIDPFDGVEDIVKRKIRSVGDPRERILKENLSRGFRALRFACIFGAELETDMKKTIKEIFRSADQDVEDIYGDYPEILAKVKAYEKEVRAEFSIPEGRLPKCLQVFWDKEQKKPRMAVAKEVMSKEIIKAISANPRRFIELLDEVGGLTIIFPELAKLRNLSQPREHHREGDALKHTLMVTDNLPKNASLRLKLAALFHDLGKAETRKINAAGKITFYEHDEKGVAHVRSIAKRFRFTKELEDDISWLVEHHMMPLTVDVEKFDQLSWSEYSWLMKL